MGTCMDDAGKLDYLNGLLPEKARAGFEEHLAACPGCRREIAELRSMAAAVAALTPPSVPAAWTAAAISRLRAERASRAARVPARPVPARRRTNILQYGAVAAGVTAALALLLWLAIGGTGGRWLPGLATAALGITDPRAARTVDLVALVLSLHALLLVPSIIDSICQIARRDGRRGRPGTSGGLIAF